MEQYGKGFQRFHAGEDVRPVTLALASFYHLFQVYYKVRQVLLQSATAFFTTKCDGLLLQSATAFLLQSATSVVTKCDRYYIVRQFYYKVRQVLQSAKIITKCHSTGLTHGFGPKMAIFPPFFWQYRPGKCL